MSKNYYSYIRVSTQRQGQKGTSLTEQTAAIDRYAKSWNLDIIKRFEERETAAKTGRPVFLDMVKALKEKRAAGVLIHKIDRSARNLRDWAELGSLIDAGVEVHFVNESLDLNSRGGRLSADIQAVVASDYIRNLREETIKGIRGRIKQGLYPFPAPPGYLNMGSGIPKHIDAVQGPLIKTAFELYATGRYSLYALVEEMYKRGLRNRQNKKVSKNGLNICLRNPFYIGLIKVASMPELYVGQHSPLILKSLFNTVQNVLNGKNVRKEVSHFFIFRRLIRCGSCTNVLVAERQKGHVYYRCHTRDCAAKPVREDDILEQFEETLKEIQFSGDEIAYFEVTIDKFRSEAPARVTERRQALQARLELNTSRLEKLADAYMDGVFDRETYATKKNTLLKEQVEMKEELETTEQNPERMALQLRNFLELSKSAYLSFKSADDDRKRDLVQTVSSNLTVTDKNLIVKLNSPFDLVADRPRGPDGCPFKDKRRTFSAFLSHLFKYFHQSSSSEDLGIASDGLDGS